jgi:hypothetical protein
MVQDEMPLLPWADRPREEAALFNPAFCGEMIVQAVHSHHKGSGRALSLPLAYVILPLVLHPVSRSGLPTKADATFRTWAVNNDALLSPLAERVTQLRAISREAILFLVQHEALALTAQGLVAGTLPLALTRKVEPWTSETNDIRRAARFLGRWFAAQGGSAVILQTLGLRP